MKAITDENIDIKCPPRELQLFLAKRDEGHGSWLTEAEVTKGEYATDSLKPLDVAGAPLALVNLSEKDVQYRVTKEDVTAKRTPVHVLVVVPKSVADAIAAPSIEKFGEMMAMQFNKVLEDRDRKRPVYSISDLDTEHYERMAKKMRIADKYLVIDEPTSSSTACIPPYSWLDVPEDDDNQRSNYIAYLETHLNAVLDEKRLSLLDVAKKPTVLSIRDPRLPFGMIGTTEVLLVDERSIQHRLPLAGVRMVVKLKKKVEDYHVAQAFGELVAASLIAPDDCTPIGLLTDLDDEWHFSWFNEKKKLTHVRIRHPKNAFDFIAAAVAEPASSKPFRVPFIRDELTKYKIDDFLPMPDDGADEMMERYELMADEVEPEFLMERRVEYARQLVQSMPMFAHMST